MAIREQLMKKFLAGNWTIDTYDDMNRYKKLVILIPFNPLNLEIPFHSMGWVCSTDSGHLKQMYDVYDSSRINLTQLFNKYLAEYDEFTWMSSLIIAREKGHKIEWQCPNKEFVVINHDLHTFNKKHTYRIDYVEPETCHELPTQEMWDTFWSMIEEPYNYIAMDKDGKVYLSEKEPELGSNSWNTYCTTCELDCTTFTVLRHFQNDDTNWKDTLHARSNIEDEYDDN